MPRIFLSFQWLSRLRSLRLTRKLSIAFFLPFSDVDPYHAEKTFFFFFFFSIKNTYNIILKTMIFFFIYELII